MKKIKQKRRKELEEILDKQLDKRFGKGKKTFKTYAEVNAYCSNIVQFCLKFEEDHNIEFGSMDFLDKKYKHLKLKEYKNKIVLFYDEKERKDCLSIDHMILFITGIDDFSYLLNDKSPAVLDTINEKAMKQLLKEAQTK